MALPKVDRRKLWTFSSVTFWLVESVSDAAGIDRVASISVPVLTQHLTKDRETTDLEIPATHLSAGGGRDGRCLGPRPGSDETVVLYIGQSLQAYKVGWLAERRLGTKEWLVMWILASLPAREYGFPYTSHTVQCQLQNRIGPQETEGDSIVGRGGGG